MVDVELIFSLAPPLAVAVSLEEGVPSFVGHSKNWNFLQFLVPQVQYATSCLLLKQLVFRIPLVGSIDRLVRESARLASAAPQLARRFLRQVEAFRQVELHPYK